MKKLIFAILATTLTFALSFAGDVIKVLKIYSDGVCTSIPLSGIDSLNHSMYDTDGNLNSDYFSTIVHAIDRNYQIPTDKIDSIKVDEIDMQEYDALTDEIWKFVKEQTELEIGTFQDNLLSWLNANDKIKNANINEEKNFISVMLKNGLSYYINFQDAAFFDEIDDSQNSATRAFGFLDENYYDVSSRDDEDIIKSTKFLFAQTCKDMVIHHYIFHFININNSEEELSMIKKNIENSPVNLEPDFTNDLTIMQKNWNDYGLVIITQTHGIEDVNGFTVVDNRDALQNASPIINIYYKEGKIINNGSLEDDENLIKYVIHKDAIQSKLNYSNTIYLGNYCWSYNFVSKNSSNMYTVIGNTSKANYNHNPIISNTITSNLFSGLTLIDAYNTKPSNILFWRNTLQISNESKKRYFSISIDDVEENNEADLIVNGKINGFSNLKKDIEFRLYYSRRSDIDFDTDKYYECPIDPTGNFKYVYDTSEDNYKEKVYYFQPVIKYKDKYYCGEKKKYEWKMSYFCPTHSESLNDSTCVLHAESWFSKAVLENPILKNSTTGFYAGTREDFANKTVKIYPLGRTADLVANKVQRHSKTIKKPRGESISWGIYEDLEGVENLKWDIYWVVY